MIALITGGSSGIGLAAAGRMAGRGARLFLLGRDRARLEAAAATVGATPLAADVTDPAAVAEAVEQIRREAGALDVLVNAAGQLEVGPAARLGPEAAERLLKVNFLGAVGTIHACLPLLRRGRRKVIVNLSSAAGRLAPPYMAAYAASKFALNGYTQALRQELRPEGIHVGLVLPGPVDTPMVHGRLGGPHYPVPPGLPVLSPEQVAAAVERVIERRVDEVVLPRRLRPAIQAGAAYPRLVDQLYAALMATRPDRP